MQKVKYTTLAVFFTLCVNALFAQAYKSGDKAEAFVNGAWKDVTVLKLVSGKTDLYEVQSITATSKSTSVIATYQVKEENLRGAVKKTTAGVVQVTPVVLKEIVSPVIGSYKLYAGSQHIYFGNLKIIDNTNYKVALASDEDSYATGTYSYNATTNTIEWKTGFCWQKRWEGKVSGKRIQLNKITYGDQN